MRRSTRRRLALFVVVTALVAVAAWQWQRQQQRHPSTLLSIDPTSITRIEVTAHSGPTRRFEKRDGQWYMTAPQQGRAKTGHIEKLLDVAGAKVRRWRPRSDFDPARIGLDKPFATLHLNDQTLRFGAVAALAAQRYVEVGGHVALIPARYGTALAATVDSELDQGPSAENGQ